MSRISIIGVNGMFGSAMAKEAVSRGHEVVGTSRSGSSEAPIDGVEYRTLELTDTEAVKALTDDSDVTIISVAGGRETGDYSPVIKAHKDLIEAAPASRLFVVGGAGGLETEDGTLLIDTGAIPEEYGAEPRAFIEVLRAYQASPDNIDWVLLAPSPDIAPGEKANSYVLQDDLIAGPFVTTGTFAVAALDEIENPAHRRARFTVADGE
ncbi:NAD(P)-dependent oxidoreductase [Corynebacterium lubricantis]|uniref:NAD(P)-dependent oxidoreductase n=1 Tax=Corynebacterium lubricantis TaxID=541095 RepID=UPI000376FEA0|nr:NAD(P)H-binding protein [Corynebacterium lubricantis]